MRRILRVAKAAIVLSIVFMMTVDTANACRLFRWLFAHRGACCVSEAQASGVTLATSPVSFPVVSSAPMVESVPLYDSAPIVEYPGEVTYGGDVSYGGDAIANDCCCCGGGDVIDSYPVENGYSDVYSEGTIVDGGYGVGYGDVPIEGGEFMGGEIIGSEVIGGDVMMDASPVDYAPADSVIAPATDVAPVPDSSFDAIDSTSAPADDNPIGDAVDTPADDTAPADDGLFGGGEPTEAAADDAGGFGDVPAEDGFGDDAPAGGNDDGGFGDVPTDDADDGGFGLPVDNAPVDDVPAGGAPADGGGDGGLFDDVPTDGDGAADDDLFGGVDSGDETIGAANEVPADDGAIAEPIEDAIDPGAGDVEADSLDDDTAIDDLFGKNQPDGMRAWTDNTGSYKTIGRLVVIARTHVRLLKDNGRYSTVALERLSDSDLDYVMAVAKKLTGAERIASR